MKLPIPIHPARTGRFCDKPAVKRGVVIILAEMILVAAVVAALVVNC